MADMIFTSIIQKLSLSSSSVDYTFNNGSFSYLGIPVNQPFNNITFDNLSDYPIYYSVITDNSITVDASAPQGVLTLAPKSTATLLDYYIIRVRVNMPVGSGTVLAILEYFA